MQLAIIMQKYIQPICNPNDKSHFKNQRICSLDVSEQSDGMWRDSNHVSI